MTEIANTDRANLMCPPLFNAPGLTRDASTPSFGSIYSAPSEVSRRTAESLEGGDCTPRRNRRRLGAMRRVATVVLLPLAAACWLAAGAGGPPGRALLPCQHHHPAAGHAGHHRSPPPPRHAPPLLPGLHGRPR